jgi:hypothetical protein
MVIPLTLFKLMLKLTHLKREYRAKLATARSLGSRAF